MDPEGSPAEEAAETLAQEAAEEQANTPVHMAIGGGMILQTDHHRNLFDHKKRHKEKHGY